MEYLLSLTGKVLQDIISSTDTDNAVLANQEEAEAAIEDEDDQDEGFIDESEDDPTQPP